jgi:hypothetical protein
MPLSTIFQWRPVLLVEETTDLPQVTDKLSHNDVSSTPRMSGIGIRTHKNNICWECYKEYN